MDFNVGPLRLPVLGSTIQLHLANSKLPHLALAKIADKYGDMFSFGFGSKLAGKFLKLSENSKTTFNH